MHSRLPSSTYVGSFDGIRILRSALHHALFAAKIVIDAFVYVRPTLPLLLFSIFLPAIQLRAESVEISSLDLSKADQSWGSPQTDKSVSGKPLTIAGTRYEKGFGTNSSSLLIVDLQKSATRFTSSVGIDDDVNGNPKASVEFIVTGDDKVLFRSGVMKAGTKAQSIDVDVTGVSILRLVVTDAGDGIDYDHADWADAKVEAVAGSVKTVGPTPIGILTPAPAASPRINGPRVFGVRPGSPFLYTVRATGDRPMRFSATGLPAALTLDPATGQITGTLAKAGEYQVTLHAQNAIGSADKPFHIIAGLHIQLTPPLGWNSWNCLGNTVSQEKVLAVAKIMVSSGLANHGWTYINTDDGWQGIRGGPFNAIQPNKKFPDIKALSDAIHQMGLKYGIYSTPWKGSYEGHIGSSCDNEDGTYDWIKNKQCNEFFRFAKREEHWGFGRFPFAEQDARQWAAWGVDYMKYDWHPIDVDHTQAMAEALQKQNRDIVYSLSNDADSGHGSDWGRLANSWRTTNDIVDNWQSMSGIGFTRDGWASFQGPGHYNDPDMLVVGTVGWGRAIRPTHLTEDEQYTHISLWCLLSAPLLIGCDLEKADPFTLNLLSNDEVLDIDQDSLVKQAITVSKVGDAVVYAKPLDDGSIAVGLFNVGPMQSVVTANWKDLGIHGPMTVRDLWRQKVLGVFSDKFESSINTHGVVLVKISPVKN